MTGHTPCELVSWPLFDELCATALHHETVSHFTPDYYAEKVVHWRWVIYPWALAEGLGALVGQMQPPPASDTEAIRRLKEDHGIACPPRLAAELLNPGGPCLT